MPDNRSDASLLRLYWPYALGRAVAFAFLAIAITFSQDHSAKLGLIVFGVFALFTSGAGIWFARAAAELFGPARWVLVHSVVSAVAGVAAIGVAIAGAGGICTFLVVLAGWAAITGLIDAFTGMRAKPRHSSANDWIVVGLWTMIAAVVFVLVPPDFSEQFVGEQKVSGVLDSSVVSVGFLGAYAAVASVFLIIAALSARWAPVNAAADPTSQPKTQPNQDITESESR